MKKIQLAQGKKAYFASDFHLGAPSREKSVEREKKIVRWLKAIENECEVLFLCGDLFDFWFEYKRVVPKGFVRLFGQLASMTDNGMRLIIFTGNHDMWMLDYLEVELSAEVYREPQAFIINSKKMLVGHGDGLGPGDYSYKILKRVFESKVCRFLFGRVLHANLGQFLGNSWASHSWRKHEKDDDVYHFIDENNELLFQYCKSIEEVEHYDFYIFGHRHYKLSLPINENSIYFNLGDWIRFNSYGEFDGEAFRLNEALVS